MLIKIQTRYWPSVLYLTLVFQKLLNLLQLLIDFRMLHRSQSFEINVYQLALFGLSDDIPYPLVNLYIRILELRLQCRVRWLVSQCHYGCCCHKHRVFLCCYLVHQVFALVSLLQIGAIQLFQFCFHFFDCLCVSC